MAKRKIAGCENCQQDINYISAINCWPGLGAKTKEGAWCFGCFKNISHCLVCEKSVAWVEYNKHEPDLRLRWTVKPANGFEQHKKFICSQNCLDKYLSEKKRKRQERLSQGWKECEGCVEKYTGIIKKYNLNWIKLKLVPPGQKLCGNYDYVGKGGCREAEEIGKPTRQRAEVKAQEYWNSLSCEQRLQEIERLDSVFTAKWWGKNYTAEEIATWEKCPPDIVEEFCRHEIGESWEEIKKKNNSQTAKSQNQVLSPSETTTSSQAIKKQVELQKLKEKSGSNSEEVHKLEREIQELLKGQKVNPTSGNPINNNKIITYSIIGFSLLALAGFVIILVKPKQKKPKIK